VIQLGTRAQRLRRGSAIGAIALLSAVVGLFAVAFFRVERSEHDAIKQADVASREATRARQAEDRVKDQLDVIKREHAAKAAAETAVERGKQDLRVANADLQKALDRAEAESKHAQSESKRAQDESKRAQDAAASLERLLADERARTERLKQERRKIAVELR
jgi:chromosome segregation ATPase